MRPTDSPLFVFRGVAAAAAGRDAHGTGISCSRLCSATYLERNSDDGNEQADRRRRPQGGRAQADPVAHEGDGRNRLTKHNKKTGQFMDQKKSPAKKKFKGVRREKKAG
jgi:hypothetical protein